MLKTKLAFIRILDNRINSFPFLESELSETYLEVNKQK